MANSENGFEMLYHKFNAMILTDELADVIDGFPRAEEADCTLVYGYMDKECGLTLEVLAAGKLHDETISFFEGNDEIRSFIRIDAAVGCEFFAVDESIGENYTDKLEMLKVYD